MRRLAIIAAIVGKDFRSFLRESRVSRPRRLRAGRLPVSKRSSARAMPWQSATAWPEGPPPLMFAAMSKRPAAFAASNGWCTTMRATSRGK